MARTKLQARMGQHSICQAIKKCGNRCTNRGKYGDFCGVHIPKEECPVCYDTKRCEKLKCGHGLCRGCSDQWFATKTTCPMCREVVKEKQVARRYNPESTLLAQLEEIDAFAQAYVAMRMAFNPDPAAAQRRLEAITPRNLVGYFDLVA